MHNQRGQRIVRGQRFSASDILQVEGRAVRHPGAGLLRSVIPSGGEERAIRAANVNLDGGCVWRIPADRSSSIPRACDRYRVWRRGQRCSIRRAGRVLPEERFHWQRPVGKASSRRNVHVQDRYGVGLGAGVASTSVYVCGLFATSVVGLMSAPNQTIVLPFSSRWAAPTLSEYL